MEAIIITKTDDRKLRRKLKNLVAQCNTQQEINEIMKRNKMPFSTIKVKEGIALMPIEYVGLVLYDLAKNSPAKF